MTLKHELHNPILPWQIISNILAAHTDDQFLQKSLLNMLSLKHRFDHFQYVSCVILDELFLQKYPLVASAIIYVSKIRNALPFFPKFYSNVWTQVAAIFKQWESRLKEHHDNIFAAQILYMNS